MEASEAQTPPEPRPGPSEPPSEPAQAPETAQEGEGRERDEAGRLLSKEAARYRSQLRETEGHRDRLQEQLDRLQRAEVERLAGQAGLAVAGDVWQFGATLDTLRGEDGTIDADTVTGVVDAIVSDRPGLKAQRMGSFKVGQGNTAGGGTRAPAPGLSQLLKPGQR